MGAVVGAAEVLESRVLDVVMLLLVAVVVLVVVMVVVVRGVGDGVGTTGSSTYVTMASVGDDMPPPEPPKNTAV